MIFDRGGLGVFGFEVEPFDSAVRLDPNNCFARMKLAVVHSRSGQLQQVRTRNLFCALSLTPQQALTELELVRQLQPKSMETLFALGKLLFRMGNTSLALVRCVSLPPAALRILHL